MIPLMMADVGQVFKIRKIGGSEKVRHHLLEMGFVVGAFVTVVASIDGSIIVKVKESRVAINSDMASKILV